MHGRNFVVKCGGSLVWRAVGAAIYYEIWREKCGGTWHIIFPLSEKVEGRVPRIPHLIAPMPECFYVNNCCFWARATAPSCYRNW